MGKDAKYVVTLTVDERAQLQKMLDDGLGAKQTRRRARVLLEADRSDSASKGSGDGPYLKDQEVAVRAQVSTKTVARLRKRFVESGFDAAVFKSPATDRLYRKLDGDGEAALIATACSAPPEGRCKWTLHLLADQLVALEVVDTISHECVRQTLKKTNCVLT